MTEYDAAFGRKLAETALIVLGDGIDSQEAERTVAYISLLSTEISLKSMLERAGVDPKTIRKQNHSLQNLLKELGGCEVEIDFPPGFRKFVSATRLRPVPVTYGNTHTAVGRIIEAEQDGASKYPNAVRYGSSFSHYPPQLLSGMAIAVANFASEHWDSIRVKRRV
jgi:hypothetical protein